MVRHNYKFPPRAANRAITIGPDATIKARTVSCASISKFIIHLFIIFKNSRIYLRIETVSVPSLPPGIHPLAVPPTILLHTFRMK